MKMKVEKVVINIDDRVVTIKNGKLRKGIIRNIYADIPTPILVVEFDDGEIEKVYPGDVALEPKAEPVKEETKEEKPVEKSEITITPGEFKKIGIKTIMKFSDNDPIVALCLTTFCANLQKALFTNEGEND